MTAITTKLQQKNLELAIIEEFISVLTTCEGHRDVLNSARSVYAMIGAKEVKILWQEFRIKEAACISPEQLQEYPDTSVKDDKIMLLMKYRNSAVGIVIIEPYEKSALNDEEKLTIYKIISNALSLMIGSLLEKDMLKKRQRLSRTIGPEQANYFFNRQVEEAQKFEMPIGIIKVTIKDIESMDYNIIKKLLAFVLETLEFNIRSIDFVSRYDNDSFLIILPGFDQIYIKDFSDTLKADIEKETNDFMRLNHFSYKISYSFMELVYPQDKDGIENIM